MAPVRSLAPRSSLDSWVRSPSTGGMVPVRFLPEKPEKMSLITRPFSTVTPSQDPMARPVLQSRVAAPRSWSLAARRTLQSATSPAGDPDGVEVVFSQLSSSASVAVRVAETLV